MKILIIGEYSGFSKNLSLGFEELGHECFVFSWGDGFKKIQQSVRSYTIKKCTFNSKSGFVVHIISVLISLVEQIKLKLFVRSMSEKGKWDVALVINLDFIRLKHCFWKAGFTEAMINSLLIDKSQIYLSSCGYDIPYFDYWKDRSWKNKKIIDLNISKRYTAKEINHHCSCLRYINKVIPVMYGYAEPWRKSKFAKGCVVFETIPLPVSTINYESHNIVKDKIVIFHGIIRPEDKGTPIIVEAMDLIQCKYGNKVECIAKGGMPLNEYLPLLYRTNILIDQVYADSVGMNGLFALAMGKVVLGGNEIENQKEFKEFDCPIINIEPNVDMIFNILEDLIMHPQNIELLATKSRKYVERVHNSKLIAQRYIETFSKG